MLFNAKIFNTNKNIQKGKFARKKSVKKYKKICVKNLKKMCKTY